MHWTVRPREWHQNLSVGIIALNLRSQYPQRAVAPQCARRDAAVASDTRSRASAGNDAASVTSASAGCEERCLGRSQLRAIIAAREQVAVGVGGHLDRGMPDPHLHHLERQFAVRIILPRCGLLTKAPPDQ